MVEAVFVFQRRRRTRSDGGEVSHPSCHERNINEVTSRCGEASVGGADGGPRRHRLFQPLIKRWRGKRPLGSARRGGLVRPGRASEGREEEKSCNQRPRRSCCDYGHQRVRGERWDGTRQEMRDFIQSNNWNQIVSPSFPPPNSFNPNRRGKKGFKIPVFPQITHGKLTYIYGEKRKSCFFF